MPNHLDGNKYESFLLFVVKFYRDSFVSPFEQANNLKIKSIPRILWPGFFQELAKILVQYLPD